MHIDDLEKVRALAEKRRSFKAVLDRLTSGAKLTLTIGEGGNEAALVLAFATASALRTKISAELDAEIRAIDLNLRRLGVDNGDDPEPDEPAPAPNGPSPVSPAPAAALAAYEEFATRS